ncbi:MAG TPA: iron-containing redox enzyme family protein [Aquella sp.]|nr:iron-containing redox enzyme family protein [Aquella sp.]
MSNNNSDHLDIIFGNKNFSDLTTWAIAKTKNNGWHENSYKHFLRDATREDFLKTQIPFYHAVKVFPRALAKLAYCIEDSTTRLPVIENLWEEHGKGDISKFHLNTFQQFLYSLNWNGEHATCPGVENWVNNLLSFQISASEYAAYLSGIEFAYAMISHDIANKLVTLELNGPQVHYDLHAALDWEHGGDLLKLAFILMDTQDHLDIDRVKESFSQGQEDFLNLYSQMLIPYFDSFEQIMQQVVESRNRQNL